MLCYDFPSRQWCGLGVDKDYTLEEAKIRVSSDIEKFASDLRNFYCSSVSPYEASSWSLKKLEAELAGTSNPLMLTLEAAHRGIPVASLVSKVLSKSSQLAMLEAVIAGNTGRHVDYITTLLTVEEVINYDWSTGWPMG